MPSNTTVNTAIPTYEINKELVLSTGHVSEKTMELLDNWPEELDLVVYPNQYGVKIMIPSKGELAIHTEHLTGSLKPLVLMAYDFGCHTLLLDRDGPLMDNLTQYSW